MKRKKTLGRKDKANFPEFKLVDIDIKIDTGAYTSAVHCRNIKVSTVDGVRQISFVLLDPSHPHYNNREFTTQNFREKWIKSSFGKSEQRFVIRTKIVVFGRKYPIELSLSERGEMRFPILIGRKFLMGRFIVDPSKYDLSFKLKQEKNKSNKL